MPPSLQDAVNELLRLYSVGRFADMEQRAKAVLKSFAGTPLLRELLGLALAAQRRFSEALPHFERAARDRPDDPQFWDNLALCQCELKDYEPAERSLRKSLALQPASIDALSSSASERIRPASDARRSSIPAMCDSRRRSMSSDTRVRSAVAVSFIAAARWARKTVPSS